MLKIEAYAKINLGLDVLKKRSDGYHEVKMVMQNVDISDALFFEKTESGIEICTDNGELPTDGNNLIYKAAELFLNKYGIADGVKISLQKRIPIAAGMAGGSTDAAATLNGLNELFKVGAGAAELKELSLQIGADVPYCIEGGTVLAEGIGEKLTRLKSAPPCILLVAKPDIGVSTKYVYEHLDAQNDYPHPDIDGMVAAVAAQDLAGITERLGNVLESVTIRAYPIVGEIKRKMTECKATGSLMSGSGPTVFGFFRTEKEALEAGNILRDQKMASQVFVTGFVERSWRRIDG